MSSWVVGLSGSHLKDVIDDELGTWTVLCIALPNSRLPSASTAANENVCVPAGSAAIALAGTVHGVVVQTFSGRLSKRQRYGPVFALTEVSAGTPSLCV